MGLLEMGNNRSSNQQGFTIIELMIATAVFAFVMLIATTGIIKIGQLYYKGVTVTKTQDTTRAVSEEISRAIQFSDGNRRAGAAANKFCLGDTRYTYNLDQKYDSSVTPLNRNTGLIAEKIAVDANCVTTPSASADQTRQLLGNQMRLLNFELVKLPLSNDAWSVNIKVAYGDNDLLSHYFTNGTLNPAVLVKDANCKSGIAGTSFCAVAKLDTVVKKRLN